MALALLAALLVSCAAPAASPTPPTQAPPTAVAVTPAATAGASSAATPATQPAQPAQTITLKVADSMPATHYVPVHAAVPWMERVKELSKAKVRYGLRAHGSG